VRKQNLHNVTTGLTAVILLIALTFMINWLGARHWRRLDWTKSHLYTLSEKTGNVLHNLKDEVKVVVFMTPASALYDQVHELLSRYGAASDKIKVEYIDPDKEPLKTKQLAQQYGISAANTVVFAVGDRTKYVSSDQMAEYDYSGLRMGQQPTVKSFKGEEMFTSAILSLVAPTVPKVYFVTGHGEASLAAAERGRTINTLKEALKRENVTTADTSLLSGKVPEDADVLAILGPTAPFAANEIEVLSSWLEAGGRLVVCLDPLIGRDGTMKSTRLEPLLKDHGVAVQNDLVIDPSRRLPFFDLSAVYLTDFTPHPVTQGLEGMAVLFPVTRSLKPVDGPDWTARGLVRTSAEGWGETNLAQLLKGTPVAKDDTDVAGPVDVAVVVETKEKKDAPGDEKASGEAADSKDPAKASDGKGFRLVAFGDSDFLTDGQIANAGNMTLALNAFNWLAHREEALGIPPRAVEHVSLFLSKQQLNMILLITLLFMPAAVIVTGIVVWRRRRH